MLYANSYPNQKIRIFRLLLENLLDGNKDYQEPVKTVLNDTHLLATGRKNLYQIDRDNYIIIVYLNHNAHDFFKKKITYNKSTYRKVQDFVSGPATSLAFA